MRRHRDGASLRSLGYVIGAARAVLDAVRLAVGEAGTLVMPSQLWQLCDPAFLDEPHVPKRWWPVIRDHLPAYDPATTPTQTMGAVAELFRTQPGYASQWAPAPLDFGEWPVGR